MGKRQALRHNRLRHTHPHTRTAQQNRCHVPSSRVGTRSAQRTPHLSSQADRSRCRDGRHHVLSNLTCIQIVKPSSLRQRSQVRTRNCLESTRHDACSRSDIVLLKNNYCHRNRGRTSTGRARMIHAARRRRRGNHWDTGVPPRRQHPRTLARKGNGSQNTRHGQSTQPHVAEPLGTAAWSRIHHLTNHVGRSISSLRKSHDRSSHADSPPLQSSQRPCSPRRRSIGRARTAHGLSNCLRTEQHARSADHHTQDRSSSGRESRCLAGGSRKERVMSNRSPRNLGRRGSGLASIYRAPCTYRAPDMWRS